MKTKIKIITRTLQRLNKTLKTFYPDENFVIEDFSFDQNVNTCIGEIYIYKKTDNDEDSDYTKEFFKIDLK